MRYRRVFQPGGTYFLTLATHDRAPLFADVAAVRLLHGAIAMVQRKRPFAIVAEVTLPDHLHWLWTLPDGDHDYPTRVRLIKTAFTKGIVRPISSEVRSASRVAKREQDIWQRRYFEHTIRDAADFDAHVDYIHHSPVRHGLVDAVCDWPHSTFHAFAEQGVYDQDWDARMQLAMLMPGDA